MSGDSAVALFWAGYRASLPPGHPHHAAVPEAFAFGGGGALADELAALVLAGRKRATTSLAVEFSAAGEPLPQAGSLAIVLDRQGRPVALIERTAVVQRPFAAVDAAYAAIEGEGDGSLAQWREDHRAYFAAVCARLGGAFDDATPVLCQVFRVCWPATAARPDDVAGAPPPRG